MSYKISGSCVTIKPHMLVLLISTIKWQARNQTSEVRVLRVMPLTRGVISLDSSQRALYFFVARKRRDVEAVHTRDKRDTHCTENIYSEEMCIDKIYDSNTVPAILGCALDEVADNCCRYCSDLVAYGADGKSNIDIGQSLSASEDSKPQPIMSQNQQYDLSYKSDSVKARFFQFVRKIKAVAFPEN